MTKRHRSWRKNSIRTARRYAMAALFSGLGFYATKTWYDSVTPQARSVVKSNARRGDASPSSEIPEITPSELSAPVLLKPSQNDRVLLETVRDSGLYLSWKPVAAATAYNITLATARGKSVRKSQSNSLKLNDVSAGEVAWSVEATGTGKALSKPSETWKFSVEDLKSVAWIDLTTPDVLWSAAAPPQASLSWDPKSAPEVKTWRIRVGSANEPITSKSWQDVSAPKSLQTFSRDGDYIAELQGLNANGVVVAKSNRRSFSVKPVPAPRTPEFTSSSLPDLSWNVVDRASVYVVHVTSKTGIVQEFETAKTNISIDTLKPGNYTLTLFAEDSNRHRSPPSPARDVIVAALNNRRASRPAKTKSK